MELESLVVVCLAIARSNPPAALLTGVCLPCRSLTIVFPYSQRSRETVDVIDEQLWILELRGVPGIWVDD